MALMAGVGVVAAEDVLDKVVVEGLELNLLRSNATP